MPKKPALKHATKSEMTVAIRVLWEREQPVSLRTIQQQLEVGQHVTATFDEIAEHYEAIKGSKEEWLAHFHPR